jgi:O-antigen/teichoic acid export membrane protein
MNVIQAMKAKQDLKRTVLKNATANLLRLAGSGIVALLLPPFLVRMLPTDTYSAWALLLQLTLYVGLLDFGIQTAVARFVAHADELQDSGSRDGIVSTALVLLAVAAALGVCLSGILAWQMPHVFAAMPPRLVREARIALLLMGGSFALGLPFSVIHAVFIGLQRNEISVLIILANRFSMAALVVGAVAHHRGLVAMGAAVAIANILSCGGSYVAWRTWAPHVKIRITLASRGYATEVASYSAALAVWFAAMLMVSGLDLSIVGVFDYTATAYYAVAATLTNFVTQAQGAIFAALLPASAVLGARGDAQRLGTLLISSTRYGTLILLAMALPLFVAGKLILRIWVGSDYARHSLVFMQILVVANVVRLTGLPYATLLMGTGQQRKVILSPLAEGVTNVLASVLGAWLLGAIGVAIGTLIGSFVSIGFHVLYNMPRTPGIAVQRRALIKQGLLRPLLCAGPCGFVYILQELTPPLPAGIVSVFIASAIVGTGVLFWNYGLVGSERRKLEAVLRLS